MKIQTMQIEGKKERIKKKVNSLKKKIILWGHAFN